MLILKSQNAASADSLADTRFCEFPVWGIFPGRFIANLFKFKFDPIASIYTVSVSNLSTRFCIGTTARLPLVS